MSADFRIKNKRKFIMREQKKTLMGHMCSKFKHKPKSRCSCIYVCYTMFGAVWQLFDCILQKPHRLLQTLRHKMWKISVTTPHIPFVFHPCLLAHIGTSLYLLHTINVPIYKSVCGGCSVATGCVRVDL